MTDNPTFDLEKRWLRAVCRYEVLTDAPPLMPDAEWDALTLALQASWGTISPVFRNAVPFSCLASSTGSGIDWTKGAPLAILEAERKLLSESFDEDQF